MSRLNAALVTVIALLALALFALGALKQHLDTAEDLQCVEDQRLIAADLRIRIPQRRDALLNDPASPIAGNPDGDIAVVSFFDYNCGVCRAAALDLQEALSNDPNVKLVFKELPVLGPASKFAARAALASYKQGKYQAFHLALMAFPGFLNQRTTLAVAERVGLDLEQLKRDMQDPAIANAITRNFALAKDLYIEGTPALVVGDEVIPGEVGMARLQRSIADARA
ncbi:MULTISPECIES: DsbA family protein [Mesorhizobium]|uniref:DsbA family protein n=1 Tax=Mesorhizobium TaxID=68287 RepID=UPI0007ECA0AE|nr:MULTISPECIES: DsbA family protein [Mesorhizobium]TPJ37961.1 DsbA family protein [Mesorhizobium sp. B2-6-6]ARP67131.1 disulfide bond formation protein DsbA [Mesorhizobium sp. WSM1497]MCA0002133.1 DsbA family protein [Mesorhizobium sp. B264B2A]MCA0008834.1 DsbA family protein [Mesorhizobium sp. B264B1B]MCA0015445.1 DsbA family protein [Mesorhizobium sp. B294B1A1]